jgi:GTP-binding protein HflX
MPENTQAITVEYAEPRKQKSARNRHERGKELMRLAESCGFTVIAYLTLPYRNSSGLLPGKGKLAQLTEIVLSAGCGVLIFGHDLSPSQKRIFEDAVSCPVINRTELILELFARQARSSTAKYQVALARLEYLLPRLEGGNPHLISSQGGSGFRGPGETQIELDRRRIQKRIAWLKRRLADIQTSKREQRKKRVMQIPLVALCGYTNAGKTSLMNRLARTSLPACDRLFATLDAAVRAIHSPQNGRILLADTVGFIRDLPHLLIEAFQSTLEEIRHASLIVIVFDASDPDYREQITVVEEVLNEIGAQNQPRVLCANKIDLVENPVSIGIREPLCKISARNGDGIEELLGRIDALISDQKRQPVW